MHEKNTINFCKDMHEVLEQAISNSTPALANNAARHKDLGPIEHMPHRAPPDDCQCKCHSAAAYCSSPSIFQRIRHLLRGFRSPSTFLHRCNQESCRTSRVKREELTYVLRSSWFKKSVSIFVSTALCQARLHMPLKYVRLVPETSESVRYTEMGDLGRLKNLIAHGSATPSDTTPDGWSLLHVSGRLYGLGSAD